jgi:hypothetical protein
MKLLSYFFQGFICLTLLAIFVILFLFGIFFPPYIGENYGLFTGVFTGVFIWSTSIGFFIYLDELGTKK